jgi:hypothetical protein
MGVLGKYQLAELRSWVRRGCAGSVPDAVVRVILMRMRAVLPKLAAPVEGVA